jgi:hypothetical protein
MKVLNGFFDAAKIASQVFGLVVLLSIPLPVLAYVQNEKLWTGLNVLRPLTEDRRWVYLVFSQFRFIDQSHPLQIYLIEGGVGRHVTPAVSVWLGYRWSAHQPYNDFFQTNRLFQQALFETLNTGSARMLLRSRFEEVVQSHQSQPSFRFRQRIYTEFKTRYLGMMNPLVYEEMFFQLNKTDYTTHQFVSENRVFIGVNLWHQPHALWEIGYINQYEWRSPQRTQNAMSHVISLNYNLV